MVGYGAGEIAGTGRVRRQWEGGRHGWVECFGGVGEKPAVGGEGRAEEAPLIVGGLGADQQWADVEDGG